MIDLFPIVFAAASVVFFTKCKNEVKNEPSITMKNL